MATVSGTATKLSDSSAVVGGKITLINSDTDEVAVSTSDVKCVTTTGALGAFEFLDVPDGITVHVVGEWDDGGTLYNAKSQPFISTGTAGDPGTLMTNYGVAADSVWIKADEDPTTFTTTEVVPGTIRITAWGSKSPAGISGTAPATESQQPVLAGGLVKFVKADQRYLTIPSPFGTIFSQESQTYTVSMAIPVWDTADNSTILSNRQTGARFRVGQGGGALEIRAVSTTIASYDPRPAYVIATWRVNNGTTVADGEFRAHLNTETVTGGAFTPVAGDFTAGASAMDIGRLLNGGVYGTMDLAELVLMPGAYLNNDDLLDLHNRMLTLYQPV